MIIDTDAIKLPEGFFEKVDNVPKFYDWLNSLPTIDAVKVVRCKDCKHNSLKRMSGNTYCDLGMGLSQLYDFCSRGKRRTDVTLN